MKQATFLTAALALPLLLVGCRDAPPPPATSPPAPRVMATGTATIQLDKLFAVTNASDAPVAVLGPNDLSVSVRPGERLVIPLREATDGQVGLALASVSAAGEVTLNGTSVRVGSEVVWGRLTSTPPAGDNLMERTFRGEADTIPASLRAVLADRLVAVPVTVGVPQSWPDFRVGSVTEGVRVERVGLLSVIHTDGCYCINEAGMLMRWIPPGSFVQAARGRGGAGRSITLTKGFWMGCTEVTRGQAALALGRSVPSGSEMPHGGLSWFEADAVVKGMRERWGGLRYELPTESEWEYVAQAGQLRPFGSSTLTPDQLTWHTLNSGKVPHAVATKQPNDWGIYDMHGNIREWCGNWWSYTPPAGVDPVGPTSGTMRTRRGGSYHTPIDWCTSGMRDGAPPSVSEPTYGMRVVLRP